MLYSIRARDLVPAVWESAAVRKVPAHHVGGLLGTSSSPHSRLKAALAPGAPTEVAPTPAPRPQSPGARRGGGVSGPANGAQAPGCRGRPRKGQGRSFPVWPMGSRLRVAGWGPARVLRQRAPRPRGSVAAARPGPLVPARLEQPGPTAARARESLQRGRGLACVGRPAAAAATPRPGHGRGGPSQVRATLTEDVLPSPRPSWNWGGSTWVEGLGKKTLEAEGPEGSCLRSHDKIPSPFLAPVCSPID